MESYESSNYQMKCMSQSYLDLSMRQRKEIVRWATQNVKKNEIVTIVELEMFMLDLPMPKTKMSLTPDLVLFIVENGNFSNLDSLHSKFSQFSKVVIKKLLDKHKEKFNDINFLQKLSFAQCEIPLKKLKNSVNSDAMAHIADFAMTKCRSESDILAENLEKCNGDVSLRLKRCTLFQEEKDDLNSAFNFGFSLFNAVKPKRVALDTFKMMNDLADNLLRGLPDLSALGADDLKEKAGALGGLNPFEMNKLPDDSILNALTKIKDITNLSPKQKNIMLEKAKSAGFSLDSPDSISELGELIDEVPTEDFKNMLPENIKRNLDVLQKRAEKFSPSQRKAIISLLKDSEDVNDLFESDLGSLAAEIPLSTFDELNSVNLTSLSEQDWDQAQDECIQAKLHYTNQIEYGVNYINGSNITESDLEAVLEHIPKNVALYFSLDDIKDIPSSLCSIFCQKIGEADLNKLPFGPGDIKRKKFAALSLDCLNRSSDGELHTLQEEDVLFLGNLICDVEPSWYSSMSENAFTVALGLMSTCFHRFTEDHVQEIQNLVNIYMGSSETWDESTLSALGPLVAFMPDDTIKNIDNEVFSSTFDSINPPELDAKYNASKLINKDSFDEKAVEALLAEENEPSSRRKRQDATPTYVTIASLGQGNTKWAPAELQRISVEDLKSSLDILGAVTGWDAEQRKVLIEQYEKAFERTSDKWTSSEIEDAKYILTDLTVTEIEKLDISNLETTGSLSDVPWTQAKRTAAVQNYLQRSLKTVSNLTSEDIAGLGNLVCGLTDTEMSDIVLDVIADSVKNLGKLICYDQIQLDALYKTLKSSIQNVIPSGPLIQDMGSIVAGMPEDDLKQISADDMPLISVGAITLMSGERFKASMTTTQLAAAGSSNIAAIIERKALFDALTTEQRNTLYNSAYGTDAPPIEDNPNGTISPKSEESVTSETSKDGAELNKLCPFVFLLYCVIFLFW